MHQAIIDLYLEVKVRTWNEIDRLGEHQLKRERERLLSLDSLTVLEYIKTSIEILMQLKDDGNENAGTSGKGGNNNRTTGPPLGLEQLALGNLSST